MDESRKVLEPSSAPEVPSHRHNTRLKTRIFKNSNYKSGKTELASQAQVSCSNSTSDDNTNISIRTKSGDVPLSDYQATCRLDVELDPSVSSTTDLDCPSDTESVITVISNCPETVPALQSSALPADANSVEPITDSESCKDTDFIPCPCSIDPDSCNIECTFCKTWFHYFCLGISESEIEVWCYHLWGDSQIHS